MTNIEQDCDRIADLYKSLEGNKNRNAIFDHYRALSDKTDVYIRRLRIWEWKYKRHLTGVLLCGWLEDEVLRKC